MPVADLTTLLTPVLAHASGFSWDEALLVLAPIAVVAGALFLANQRAKRYGEAPEPSTPDDASEDASDNASGS